MEINILLDQQQVQSRSQKDNWKTPEINKSKNTSKLDELTVNWVLRGKFTVVNAYFMRGNIGKHVYELDILLKYHKEKGKTGHRKGGQIIKK